MKKVALFFLKPLSFLPALLMMYLIFQFSAQTGELSGNLSYEVSYKIVEIGNEILDKGLDEWTIGQYAYEIEYPIRKLAHMIFSACRRSIVSFLCLRTPRFSADARSRTHLRCICLRR